MAIIIPFPGIFSCTYENYPASLLFSHSLAWHNKMQEMDIRSNQRVKNEYSSPVSYLWDFWCIPSSRESLVNTHFTTFYRGEEEDLSSLSFKNTSH